MNVIGAKLIEIFESLQGEGPYIGQAMVFVRFQDCALSCRYCDTPASFQSFEEFRVERIPQSGEFQNYPNPVRPEELCRLLGQFNSKILSLTGGEPMQHSGFLAKWLPLLDSDYKILLETNGVLHKELARIIEHVDIVSMDVKLPSATGMRAFWDEHQRFLKIARQRDVYVKVVVVPDTPRQEIERAVALVERNAPGIPFILQPVTPAGTVEQGVGARQIKEYYEFSKQYLNDVRVIPQMHPILGIL